MSGCLRSIYLQKIQFEDGETYFAPVRNIFQGSARDEDETNKNSFIAIFTNKYSLNILCVDSTVDK
jgi:hypothetical protein